MDKTSVKKGLRVVFYGDSRPEFGANGNPQRQINLPGRIESPEACSVRAWARLNGGPREPLATGPDLFRLPGIGEFNVEIDNERLSPGLNTVEVGAEDSFGTSRSGIQDFWFEKRLAAPILHLEASRAFSIYEFGQPVDGDWYLGPHGARCAGMGYDRTLAFGDCTWTDYEILSVVTIHGFHKEHPGYPAEMGPGVGFLLRWPGHHPDGNSPSVEWRPCGALGWFRYGRDKLDQVRDFRLCFNGGDTSAPGLSGLIVEDCTGFKIAEGRPYFFRMRVKSREGKPATYRMKVWPVESREPGKWNLQCEGLPCETRCGAILFVCHHTDASIASLQVCPV